MRRRVLVLLVFVLFHGVGLSAGFPHLGDRHAFIKASVQERKTRPRRVVPSPSSESEESAPPAIPLIRVALATDVPRAVISCDREIVRIEEASQQVVHLNETEIRLRPVSPPDPPLKIYRVRVAEMKNSRRAERLVKQLEGQFQQQVTLQPGVKPTQQVVYLGRFGSRQEANRFATRLKRAGYRKARPVDDLPPPPYMVTAQSPSDEVLLRSPSQLTFAPLDEEAARLKFDGRSYRGRLIVRLNERKRLTVINETSLESYLWSVVPNELGPTRFPELEALKAQAVAARTFAVMQKSKAGPAAEYDVVADVRSQLYTGTEAEHPLSAQAVNQTRGMIVTSNGEAIEAVYTSTCGGQTENSEFVFNEPRPYLRSVRCAPESRWLASHMLVTKRRGLLQQPVALFRTLGLLSSKLKPDRLNAEVTPNEIEKWIIASAKMMKRSDDLPSLKNRRLARFDGFAQALVAVFYPRGYVEALFAPADIDYILDYADTTDLSPQGRAAVAILVKDGMLSPSHVSRLDGHAAPSRLEALTILTRLLERAGRLPLNVGVTRSLSGRELMLEPDGEEARAYRLAPEAMLFKQLGLEKMPVKRLVIVGGEKVWFHTEASGRIDYLQLQPHPAGVAHDRYSPVSRWEVRLTPSELTRRLRRRGIEAGRVMDLKIEQRGVSGRVVGLQVVGTRGREELRRSAIRSTLGLRENLFVIDRKYDQRGRIMEFAFIGRGWGHGVGLCQVGAYGLAVEGLTYQEILKTYYTGVEITRIY